MPVRAIEQRWRIDEVIETAGRVERIEHVGNARPVGFERLRLVVAAEPPSMFQELPHLGADRLLISGYVMVLLESPESAAMAVQEPLMERAATSVRVVCIGSRGSSTGVLRGGGNGGSMISPNVPGCSRVVMSRSPR
jgi:hypothetical protein